MRLWLDSFGSNPAEAHQRTVGLLLKPSPLIKPGGIHAIQRGAR
jgi:hypothetical protein